MKSRIKPELFTEAGISQNHKLDLIPKPEEPPKPGIVGKVSVRHGSLLSLQFVSEQLIFFHKRRDIHMNNSAAMLNQIVPSDYIFRIIIFDAF